ncbi:MAG: hypothetical protein A2031_04395 [Deltaproteobacteria bacterium RBG_19FT_COMBO_43_11]|nr:MAG: hypothetical protein A2031_04395 [Deltaproteobacteria bacterium RBG_19FT_COMBO_43_11]
MTPNELVLKVPLLGTYKFSPSDIIRFEPNKGLYGANVILIHNILDYPEKISLAYQGEANELTLLLNQHGFIPQGVADALLLRTGIVVRWSFLLIAVLLWNAFLFYGHIKGEFRVFSFIAIALVFIVAVLLPHSEALQSLILKPGRRVGEIKPSLNLFKWISGIIGFITIFNLFLEYGQKIFSFT